jgi:hypothetical protein
VATHDEAATAVQRLELLRGHGARLDVGVVDDGPHVLARSKGGLDGLDLLGHACLDDGEDLLDRAAGGLDARPQRNLDLADGLTQVPGRALPVG